MRLDESRLSNSMDPSPFAASLNKLSPTSCPSRSSSCQCNRWMHICDNDKMTQETLERMFAQDLNVANPYLGYDFAHPIMVSTAGVAPSTFADIRGGTMPDF